jgi:large subunit ribosomal protein L11
MAKETVEVLIQGGKATAAPPLGPALGPMGVNIGKVVADINKATESFKGMQVPVKVIIDSETKDYEIKVGTPPASALIKKEANIQKGSSNPHSDFVADLKIEQVIKIAKMKETALLGKDLKQKVKEIIGTCRSMGILVEGVKPEEAIKDVNSGKYDDKILSGKTEISAEERKKLEEEKKKLEEEHKKKMAVFEKQAKEILEKFKNKESKTIRKAMKEAGIPDTLINELAPEEKKK